MIQKIGIAISTVWVALFATCPAPKQDSDCNSDRGSITKWGFLPSYVLESSGLTFYNGQSYTISDSGNDPIVYAFDIERPDSVVSITMPDGIKNKDWESITSDDQGNLYIADIGNNKNKRDGLKFYKYNLHNQLWGKIHISYTNQTAFPPDTPEEMLFDAEASFWYEGYLYIFTKPATRGSVFVYRCSDRPGRYQLEPIYTLEGLGRVTGADINSRGDSLAILSYGRLWFASFTTDVAGYPNIDIIGCKRLIKSGQVEAVAFDSQNRLFLTNESGKIFRWVP